MKQVIFQDRNKVFGLFLLSQGISNLGDTFQFIAATSLLVRVTGSGVYAAFGLVCGPILSILFSSLAGYLCDIKHEKTLLVIIDIMRCAAAVLFISKSNVAEIYVLIIILSTLDMFYNPPRKKMIANILNSSSLMTGNSIINGVSGFMYIIGPITAGVIISKYGENFAFLINGVSFLISAFIILVMKYRPFEAVSSYKTGMISKSMGKSAIEGIKYCLKADEVRNVVFLGTMVCFVSTSVNMAFYPYAFDILKMSGKVWGGMMSVFYGANVIAMLITLLVKTNMKKLFKFAVPSLLAAISAIWILYGTVNSITGIMCLQLAEGTSFSFLNTALLTYLQSASRRDTLGRVIGVNDFINSLGKILGVIFAYLLMSFRPPDFIFFVSAVILLCYVSYTLLKE